MVTIYAVYNHIIDGYIKTAHTFCALEKNPKFYTQERHARQAIGLHLKYFYDEEGNRVLLAENTFEIRKFHLVPV